MERSALENISEGPGSQHPSEPVFWDEWAKEQRELGGNEGVDARLERFLPEWFKYKEDQKSDDVSVSSARFGVIGTEYSSLKDQLGGEAVFEARAAAWLALPEQVDLRLRLIKGDLNRSSKDRNAV